MPPRARSPKLHQHGAEVVGVDRHLVVVLRPQFLAGERFDATFGFLRVLWKVCRSQQRAVMRSPVRCWIMSIQCEPMSAITRIAPFSFESSRQL